MIGTIRTFDMAMRDDIQARLTRTAQGIAQSMGASAAVVIEKGEGITYNDPALVARMRPTLERVLGPDRVVAAPPTTTTEDFSVYQQKVPGMFFFLGVTPTGTDPKSVAPNHSPRFFADEAALVPGLKAMANLALDYLAGGKAVQ
jgi:amidohydrolase